jgi:hypothetical protein
MVALTRLIVTLYVHCLFCSVWILEQTAIIFVYNINWLISTGEENSVYCEVRTESQCSSGSVFSLTLLPNDLFWKRVPVSHVIYFVTYENRGHTQTENWLLKHEKIVHMPSAIH